MMTTTSSSNSNNKRSNQKKRRHNTKAPPPKPLGVLEFTSALNGDDPLQILQKLHHFVKVAEYQRRLVVQQIGGHDDDHGNDDTTGGGGGGANNIDDDDDDASYISFDEEDDDNSHPSLSYTNKRQKLLQSTTSSTSSLSSKVKHSWKLDKNNYNVPFVGTSVTKGETGTMMMITTLNTTTITTTNTTPPPPPPPPCYCWPTGFMEVYRRYSPLGVELITNEYITALPPGGVHKMLYKDDDSGNSGDSGNTLVRDDDDGNDESGSSSGGGKRRRKKRGTTSTTANTTSSNVAVGQTTTTTTTSRGKIISITLQSKYWMAVNEWILSFIPLTKLQRELHWKDFDYYHYYYSTNNNNNNNNNKCALPPSIMTVLIKERLPEWIDAIHKYIAREQYYAQVLQKERKEERLRLKKLLQQRQQQLTLSTEEKVMEQKRQQQIQLKNDRVQRRLMKQQSREEVLLLSALHCLISLCHLSNGTAREVLRRLVANVGGGGVGGGKSSTAKINVPSAGSHGGGGKTADGGGTEWMVQLFQQGNKSSLSQSSSSNKPQVLCVRLVCTLLETQDFIVLSRLLAEVPSPGWATKRGGGKKDVGNFGVGHVALRYGIQRLLDIVRRSSRQSEHGDDDDDDEKSVEDDVFAECIARLLRGVNGIILPSSETKNQNANDNGSKKHNKGGGFVLGMGVTADLLSGEVLGNLSELSLLAPQFDPTFDSIQDIINGDDVYNDLDSIETAAVEARRLLFVLLADTRRSPFLRDSSSSSSTAEKQDDQFTSYFPQLSKSLHSLMSGQGHSVSLKMILGLCLRTTPEITPHFFRSLQLSDPKPTYRSLAALTFVEGVVRDIPCPRVRALRDGKMSTTEQILSEIIPNCVTKSLLSKVLQSSCALLTSGGLKLIITLLRRARGLSFDECSANGDNSSDAQKELQGSLNEAMMSHMPELPILLSIPSRFDPFETQTVKTSSHANTSIVMLQLCEAFQCYAQIDPSFVVNAKYDWVKFLPLDEPSKRSFFNAEPLLQYRILRNLLLVSKLDQMSFSSKMLPSALSIMTSATATTPEVYAAARELSLSLLEQEIFPHSDKNVEAKSCRNYETSLWVDVISEDTIDDLMTMVAEARQQSVQHKMTILQALSKANLGYDLASSVSSLLSLSISYLMSDTKDTRVPFSKEFGSSLIQISTKMLLFQANAKHFAALIVYAAPDHSPYEKNAAGLHQVAKALLDDGIKANIHLHALVSNIFHRECLLNYMLGVSIGNAQDIPECDFTPEVVRQCLSLLKYTAEGKCRDDLLNLLRQIVVHICAVDGAVVVTEIETILVVSALNVEEFEGIMIVLFSLLRSSGFQSMNTELESSLMKDSDEAMNGLAGMKVVTSLLRHNVVPANHPCRVTDDIWKECCTVVASDDAKKLQLKHFLLAVVLRIFPDAKASVISPLLATTMFDLWAALADDLEEMLSLEVCIHLSDCLAEIFISPKKGHLAWYVYQGLCKMGMTAFVGSCLRTLFKQEELGRQSKRCFLASVMSYDSTSFACLTKVLFKKDDNYERLWQSGLLDMAAFTCVMKMYAQRGSGEAVEGFKMAEVAGNRFLTLLHGVKKNEVQVLSLEMIVDVIEKLCFDGYIGTETVQCLLGVFRSLENGTLVLPAQQEMQMVRLVICIAASKQEKEIDESKLIAKAFLRCCKLIPKCLKKAVRSKGLEGGVAISLEKLIGYTAYLLECADHFSDEVLSSSSSIVDSLIVACLKYGMVDTSDFTSCSVFGGCLKMIRLILSQTSEGELSKVRTIVPGQVHAMAISHSALELAISKKEGPSKRLKSSPTIARSDGESQFCDGLSQQQELIRLLLCCVSLDANQVKIGTDTWASILSAYDASTGVADGLLRRLLFLYDVNKCCEDEVSYTCVNISITYQKKELTERFNFVFL